MNSLVISQETLDANLPNCKDGETGSLNIPIGTFKLVPGIGAVVSFDTITKDGGAPEEAEPGELSETGNMPNMKKMPMSPAAAAVVNRTRPPRTPLASY